MVVLVCYAFGRRRVPDSGSHQPAPPAAEENLKLSLASPDPDVPQNTEAPPTSSRPTTNICATYRRTAGV